MTENHVLQDKLSQDLERIEIQFGHRLGQAALFGLIALPMIPGLLTMISIGVHFPHLLGIHYAVAWGLGFFSMVGIEVLGLFSIRLALKMRKFNHRAEGYGVEKAPIAQGYLVAGAYVTVVMVLTVLLKIAPEWSVWALIPLGLMGALADWVFALNGDHNERENSLRKLMQATDESVQQSNLVDTLRSEIANLLNRIKELSEQVFALRTALGAVQSERNLLAKVNTEHDTLIEQLNTRIVQQSEQLVALNNAQSDRSETDALLSQLAERDHFVNQLQVTIAAMTAQNEQLAAQLTSAKSVQVVQMPPIQMVTTAPQKVYTNGHIADDIEHLDLSDKIRVIAQRMIDAGQKVNKSKIAELVDCSRTTVQNTLG